MSQPHVLIIRDDRPEAGLGHVRRMEALAEALVAQGAMVKQCSAVDPHDDLPDVIVVDHYPVLDAWDSFAESWEEAAYRREYRDILLVVIDDFGRAYPGASLVVRPSPSWPTLAARSCLHGAPYALLNRRLRDVTVSEEIDVFDTLATRSMPWEEFIRELARARVVISSGGVTCMEAACLGKPQVIVARDAGERMNAEVLRLRGAALAAAPPGWDVQFGCAKLGDLVDSLLRQPEARTAMGVRGRNLIDGRGADRVASAILELVQ